jgi:hypothetical protein
VSDKRHQASLERLQKSLCEDCDLTVKLLLTSPVPVLQDQAFDGRAAGTLYRSEALAGSQNPTE